MYAGNPVYNTLPTTPPGLEGLRYLAGSALAGISGGTVMPYVPPNQSVFEAQIATANLPLYRSMMASTYSQLGGHTLNTLSGMNIARKFGEMSGLSEEETRRALAYGSFGSGAFGQIAMPMLDSLLSSAGISGGSYVAAANQIYGQRMRLLSPGMASPLDMGQQRESLAAAHAMSSLLAGGFRQTDSSGRTLLLPDQRLTRGFSIERIAGLAMQAAGHGAFTVTGEDGRRMGFGESLKAAAGGMDLRALSWDAGDFTGGGEDSVFVKDSDLARQVKSHGEHTIRSLQGMVEAMAAP